MFECYDRIHTHTYNTHTLTFQAPTLPAARHLLGTNHKQQHYRSHCTPTQVGLTKKRINNNNNKFCHRVMYVKLCHVLWEFYQPTVLKYLTGNSAVPVFSIAFTLLSIFPNKSSVLVLAPILTDKGIFSRRRN